jgi:outer membrane biosynthesis protein TonB
LVVALFMAIFGKKKAAPEPQPAAIPEPIPTPSPEPLPMPGPVAPPEPALEPEPAPEVEPTVEPEAGAVAESLTPTDVIDSQELSEETKPWTPPQDGQL